MDGKGSATITDLIVELVENRDRYEDVYPSDSEEEEEDDCSDESDSEDYPEGVKALIEEVEKIERAMA